MVNRFQFLLSSNMACNLYFLRLCLHCACKLVDYKNVYVRIVFAIHTTHPGLMGFNCAWTQYEDVCNGYFISLLLVCLFFLFTISVVTEIFNTFCHMAKKHVILYHTGNRFFSICPWYSQLSSQKPNLICLQVPPCSLTFQDLLPYSRADSRSCYEVPCCKVLALRCLTVMSMLQGALL